MPHCEKFNGKKWNFERPYLICRKVVAVCQKTNFLAPTPLNSRRLFTVALFEIGVMFN